MDAPFNWKTHCFVCHEKLKDTDLVSYGVTPDYENITHKKCNKEFLDLVTMLGWHNIGGLFWPTSVAELDRISQQYIHAKQRIEEGY